MHWDIVGTWIALGISVLTGAFKVGQLVKTIEGQQTQINKLEQELDTHKDVPIKLATLETDIKYLVQGISRIEQILMKKAD